MNLILDKLSGKGRVIIVKWKEDGGKGTVKTFAQCSGTLPNSHLNNMVTVILQPHCFLSVKWPYIFSHPLTVATLLLWSTATFWNPNLNNPLQLYPVYRAFQTSYLHFSIVNILDTDSSFNFSKFCLHSKQLFRSATVIMWDISQRSKLTFSKSCLLATFNCKMVALRKNSVAKKKENLKGRTLHDILHVAKKGEDTSWHSTWIANALKGTFSILYFATVSLRIHVEFLNGERGKEKDRWCRRLYYWLNSSYYW